MREYKHQKHRKQSTGRHCAQSSRAYTGRHSCASTAAAPVKGFGLRDILLVIAVLVLSIGCFTTIAYMRASGGEITNSFFGANIYRLDYHANAEDASGSVKGQTEIMASSETECKFTLKENGFSRDGYVFLGWDFSAAAEIPAFRPGDDVTVDIDEPNRTIYAIWKPPPGDLPNPGIKPRSPTVQAHSLPSELLGNPRILE